MSSEGASKSGRTQIIVAVITVVGALGGALFANWDKVFPARNPESLGVTSSGSATATSSQGPSEPGVGGSTGAASTGTSAEPSAPAVVGSTGAVSTRPAQRPSSTIVTNSAKEPVPRHGCSISGTVFDPQTKRPLPGLIVGLSQDINPKGAKQLVDKGGKILAFNVATSGLDGTFKANCGDISRSDFPVQIVVSQLNPPMTHSTTVKVEFGDELTNINLPITVATRTP